ncbi:hypothetical protein ACEPAG_2576 [Sanghuangporus baumii]
MCALDDPETPPFHYVPYKEYWNPPYSRTSKRIYGELYSSDVWLEAHEKIRAIPAKDGLENFMIPIMLYSDSTHLANFGNTSLWPLYMYFGSQSKLARSKSTGHVCHHMAYFPSLPASIQDAYKDYFGRTASADALTFLKCELMQAVLKLVLFQPDFLEAYTEGITFICSDGVTQRLFPRFMVYSADYPERMLVATLRNNAQYPCPSCLISRARKLIFEHGKGVESKVMNDILSEESLVPVNNAFSALIEHDFNFFTLFVPDLMHEFELGVWKSLLIHLIRILCAQGGDLTAIFNNRFCSVPTFSNSTIRRFIKNTASMTKLAARDFEDILSCIIPVFHGILEEEEHLEIILDLLFDMVNWHALAKLRVHTETTVCLLEEATKQIGRQIRYFKATTCRAYKTKELKKEVIARGRRKAALLAKQGSNSQMQDKTKQEPKHKEFNINTPKVHSLGKYAQRIRMFGTTDSYSMQIGESQHKHIKCLYGRTNKKNAARDVCILEGQAREFHKIEMRVSEANGLKGQGTESDNLSKASPEVHHHIAWSKKDWVHIHAWLDENEGDPALENFLPQL